MMVSHDSIPTIPGTAELEALDQALADVDRKLDAWLSAVSSAQALLGCDDTTTAPAAEQGAPAPTDGRRSRRRSKRAGKAAAAVPQPVSEPAPPPAAPTQDVPPATAMGGEEPSEADVREPTGLPSEESAGPQMDEVFSSAEAPAEEAAPSAQDDDELLLESLDTATRREIRIRRRFCNNRKSVRQLLEELQRDQIQQLADPKHRSWWRKGKS